MSLAMPSRRAAAHARNLVGTAVRAAYRVRVTGVDRVPVDGPLLLVANHPGALDAALLIGTGPRPVHVVSDTRGWPAPLDRWSRSVGEVPFREEVPDRAALRAAVAALADGRAVAMFPEGMVGAGGVDRVRPGVGYVLARSGATVLPVALFGTRGGHPMDPPRPRTRVDVVYGDPVPVRTDGADPLRRADLLRLAERVRQVLADHVVAAAERTGRAVPPPVPEDGRASA